MIDPITFEKTKKPMKPFMVTQLQIAFERNQMILSEFDEVLHKQLIDYEVIRLGKDKQPVFSSKNEHFIDALGLSYLAFVLKFPELTKTIKKPKTSTKIEMTSAQLGQAGPKKMLHDISQGFTNPWESQKNSSKFDPTDLPGDRPVWQKVSTNYRSSSSSSGWGTRSAGTNRNGGRSIW